MLTDLIAFRPATHTVNFNPPSKNQSVGADQTQIEQRCTRSSNSFFQHNPRSFITSGRSTSVLLKVGGITLLGAILKGTGAYKTKGATGGQNNTNDTKTIGHCH